MNKVANLVAVAALIPAFASADTNEILDAVKFYGKANIDFQSSDEGAGSYSEVKSNASRVGVKGAVPLGGSIKGIYKMEFQANIDDGEDAFTQRNSYAGFEGDFGQIIGGKFDTPLKAAQNKVDLFNALEGDIKSIITKSDNRAANSLQYTSPSFAGIKATVADTRDNGTSVSLIYNNSDLYIAYAFDQGVEAQNWDVERWVAQYRFSQLTLGVLYETQDTASRSNQTGWISSAAYNLNDWTIKAQYGQSDIVEADAETYSLGLDYKVSSAAKVFAFWTDETAKKNYDKNYVGIGTELKF